MAVHGLPAMKFLTTKDGDERAVLLALLAASEKHRERLDHNLAAEVVNQLAKAMR